MKFRLPLMILMSALVLSACIGGNLPTNHTPMNANQAVNLPNPSPKSGLKTPVAWKHLGYINNGMVKVEYDEHNIVRKPPLVYLNIRQIVQDSNIKLGANLPKHKSSHAVWEFNCPSRQYRLTYLELFDANGRLIAQSHFSAIRPFPVSKGSIAEREYNLVCH